MTKELEALKQIERDLEVENIFDDRIEEIKIIETALKRLEELEQKHNKLLYNYQELVHCGLESEQKKVKAFEIIKEKRVDVNWLLACFTHTKELESYNQDRRHKITKEEYDFLKEVLL